MNLNTVLITFGWIIFGVYAYKDPKVLYSWKYLEFEYESSKQESDAKRSGAYDLKSNFLTDAEVAADGRIFVTILREKGVPASLATIGNRTGDGGGPLLRPYPDWSWTNASDCDNLVAVYRTALDKCNRLWVLDTGKVGDDIVCDPKLLAFDLSTNKLVQRVDIPPKLSRNADGVGLLVYPVVETMGTDCAETNVYMADMYGSGLVIWNGKDTWRIESPYFAADPNATEFSVNGTDFNYVRGLFALSITAEEKNATDRVLYFRPLSSYDMYHTQVEDLYSKKQDQSSIEYIKGSTKLQSQSIAQAFSSKGILFFSGTTETSILCWNQQKSFTPENIVTVAQNETTLQWVDAVKIYPSNSSETIVFVTDRWQNFYTKKMNFNEINFRILVSDVNDLVHGTNCE